MQKIIDDKKIEAAQFLSVMGADNIIHIKKDDFKKAMMILNQAKDRTEPKEAKGAKK